MSDILKVRESLHRFIDPMWQSGWRTREELYEEMSRVLEKDAHISNMSLEDLEKVCKHFLNKDRRGWPCEFCKNCTAYRYFLPVCKLGQQRKEDTCAKRNTTENI